jgi:hypothetical protein
MAELIVAADLVKRGYRVAFPFGEDCDFDLLFWRPPSIALERVQVKYTESNAEVIDVCASSHSLTNGRVRATKRYTQETIDWLAAYDVTTGCCYYIPATELGSGMREIRLRLVPTKNNQQQGIRMAADYLVPTIGGSGP